VKLRGINWLYSFLKSFYQDPAQQWGTNNLIYPNVAMPNVLLNLQGIQVFDQKSQTLHLLKPGDLSPQEFDKLVKDLVNFLNVVTDPNAMQRKQIGVAVVTFLGLFALLLFFLKQMYWRQIK
jgi:cytochrome c1